MTWLGSRSGQSNAYTAGEHTNYYFEVDAASLGGALERFGSQFEAPLLRAANVEKEVTAVNNEHEKNLNADPWRQWQLLKAVSRPGEGNGWLSFGTGDKDTLAGAVVSVGEPHDQLRTFFERHYQSARMRACVAGPQPLEELERLVAAHLGGIPTRPPTNGADAVKHSKQSRTGSPNVYGEGDGSSSGWAFGPYVYRGEYIPSPKIVYYKSIADRSLSLVWAVDGDAFSPFGRRFYEYDSLAVPFLESLLDATHEGSATAALVDNNLAFATQFDVEHYDDWSLLQVTVVLTPEGVKRHISVAATVLAYLGAAHNAPDTALEEAWATHVQATEAVWNYTYTARPLASLVPDVASDSHDVPPARLLGSPLRAAYSRSVVRAYLSALKPGKAVLLLSAPDALHAQLRNNVAETQTEPIYGSHFAQRGFTDEEREALYGAWHRKQHAIGGYVHRMSLPPPNPYLPTADDAQLVAPAGTEGEATRVADMAGRGAVVFAAPDAVRKGSLALARCVVGIPHLALSTTTDPKVTSFVRADLWREQLCFKAIPEL